MCFIRRQRLRDMFDFANADIQLSIITGIFGIITTLLAIKGKEWNDNRLNKDSKSEQIASIIANYEQVIRNQAKELDRLSLALSNTRKTLDNVHRELYESKKQNYALQNQIASMKLEIGA